VDVEGEDLVPVDLDDGDQLAVARLELGVAVDRDLLKFEVKLLTEPAYLYECALTEVAILGVVDDDATGYG